MITTSKQITPHFHSTEFRCKHCGAIKIDENLVNKMEHIFSKLNASMCIISSGHRCAYYDVIIGGFRGRHYEGLAADCCYFDKDGKPIPAKIVACVAWDLRELNAIAPTSDPNYIHLDNRSWGTYYGDEARGNSSYWTNPYSYFGVSKADVAKYTGEKVDTTIKYQSHGINTRWYPNVAKGDGDYAGVFGVAMDGLYIDSLEYRVKSCGRWLPIVKGRSDYAGILGQPITDIAIKGATYRVHIKGGNWLPWVSGYDINDYWNGYAGNGSVIDAIQIK